MPEWIVDPSLDSNTGDGLSLGTAFGDLGYAMQNVIHTSASYTILHIKGGVDEWLTASLDPAWLTNLPAYNHPCIFWGFTANPRDGGRARINCNGLTAILTSGTGFGWYSMELHNGPSSDYLLKLPSYSAVANSQFYGSDGGGVSLGGHCSITGSGVWDVGGALYDAIAMAGSSRALFNYIKQGSAREMRRAISIDSGAVFVAGNQISIDGASHGIYKATAHFPFTAEGNSVLSNSGTGKGYYIGGGNGNIALPLLNNYAEGFSGVGGVGFDLPEAEYQGIQSANKAFNNTTNFNLLSGSMLNDGSNIALPSSGLAKVGDDTFANRMQYFAPLDVGTMYSGYPEKDFV